MHEARRGRTTSKGVRTKGSEGARRGEESKAKGGGARRGGLGRAGASWGTGLGWAARTWPCLRRQTVACPSHARAAVYRSRPDDPPAAMPGCRCRAIAVARCVRNRCMHAESKTWHDCCAINSAFTWQKMTAVLHTVLPNVKCIRNPESGIEDVA